MSPPDADLNIRALNYLMTAVIHRLHETDGEWWRDFLDEMKQQMFAAAVEPDAYEMLRRAIAIVEH